MSSKRRIRRNACRGKIAHATIEEAKEHVRSLFFARKIKKGDGVHPYKCAFGSHYHVGHSRSVPRLR